MFSIAMDYKKTNPNLSLKLLYAYAYIKCANEILKEEHKKEDE